MLAITGSTGFVGRHLVRLAVEAGWQVRALTRRRRPIRPGVDWIEGALENKAALARLVEGAEAAIHVAGVINAADREGFRLGNAVGTLNVVDAARHADVQRFVHVSSLTAREPALSAYGWSKAKAETIVRASGLGWTIVAPPAIYGPGDREMLELFRMAERGLVLLPPAGRLSLIEVGDLCRLLLRSVAADEAVMQTYEPDDGRIEGWSHRELADALGAAVGRARVRSLSVPVWALRLGANLDRLVRGAGAKLTPDRAGYMAHPDWVARVGHRPPPALWRPSIATAQGLKATADWYRAEGWLRGTTEKVASDRTRD